MFDLVTLRDELWAHLGVDDTDLPPTQADLLINRSYQWLLGVFKFRTKEASVTFPTTLGIRNYDLPVTFESMRGLSLEDPTSFAHTVLDRMTTDAYEQVYVETVDNYGTPTRYVREGSCIRLWKTPDQAYELTLKYDKLLSELSSTNLTPEVPKNWEEYILTGACYRGHIRFGDINRGMAMKRMLESDVVAQKPVEKKEEFDSHRANLEVILPEYEV